MSEGKGGQSGKFLWEVCGHEKIVSYLKSAIVNNNLHHAYIFAGQAGLGKATVADRFIKTLYCQGKGEYKPCGECSACRQIESKVHPDVYYVRRTPNEKTGKLHREILIDQVRDLKVRLSQGTLLSSWKIAIIEDADYLNLNAANSLLKVLEEPTPKTIVILLAGDLSRIIKTVISRSQVLNFLPVNREEIKNFLLSKEVGEDKAERISKLAIGKPCLAVQLAEDQDYFNGLMDDMRNFLDIFKLDLYARQKKLDALVDWNKDESLNIIRLNQLFNHWLMAWRDLILIETDNPRLIVSSSLAKTGKTANYQKLLKTYYQIEKARELLDRNIMSKNVLENLIINI
jgi:DNA polymerase-3 subunit delta'